MYTLFMLTVVEIRLCMDAYMDGWHTKLCNCFEGIRICMCGCLYVDVCVYVDVGVLLIVDWSIFCIAR